MGLYSTVAPAGIITAMPEDSAMARMGMKRFVVKSEPLPLRRGGVANVAPFFSMQAKSPSIGFKGRSIGRVVVRTEKVVPRTDVI